MASEPQTHRMAPGTAPRPRRTRLRLRHHYMATTALVALAAVPPVLPGMVREAQAGPEGGLVIGGQAEIARQGRNTTIRQSSDRAIIEWDNFDIAPDEGVEFRQPGRSSIALNRVQSVERTTIEGSLSANGQVWIVNPNGVHISRGASVDVGGLLATSADIDDADFMAGGAEFDIPGAPDAVIRNEGTITFGEAGLVGLVGPNAANDGVIRGRLGKVVVAGTETFAVDMAGDGILALPMGQGAAVSASNSGAILNEGGSVLMDAAAAESLLEASIVAGGEIEARSVAVSEGRIVLRSTGEVSVTGTLDASGVAGAAGGDVSVTGAAIALREGAGIDASGGAGADGGSVRFGGDRRGRGPLDNAGTALVEGGATIRADGAAGGGAGDGGQVIVFSDSVTGFAGAISVEGGGAGGDGGFAEVSGRVVDLTGSIALGAALGEAGTFLLDPDVIVVGSPPEGTPDGPPGGDIGFLDPGTYNSGTTTYVSAAFVESVTGAVEFQAYDRITVNEAITRTGAGSDLTLRTGENGVVQVFAPISIGGTLTIDTENAGGPEVSSINFYYGADIGANVTAGAISITTSATGTGQPILIYDGVTVEATVGGVAFDPGNGLLLGDPSAAGPSVQVISATGFTFPQTVLGADVTVTAGTGGIDQLVGTYLTEIGTEGTTETTLTLAAPGGAISLTSAANGFSRLAVDASQSFDIVHSTAYAYSAYGVGVVDLASAGTGSLTSDGGIILTSDGDGVFGADGGITFDAPRVVMLPGNRLESVAGTADFSAVGTLFIYDGSIEVAGDLTLPNTVATDTISITSTGGNIGQAPGAGFQPVLSDGFIPFDLTLSAPAGEIVLTNADNQPRSLSLEAERFDFVHDGYVPVYGTYALEIGTIVATDPAASSSLSSNAGIDFAFIDAGPPDPLALQPQVDVAGDLYLGGGPLPSGSFSGGALVDIDIEVGGALTFQSGFQLAMQYNAQITTGADLELPDTLLEGLGIMISTGGSITQAPGTTISSYGGANGYYYAAPAFSAAGDIVVANAGNEFDFVTAEGENIVIDVDYTYYGRLSLIGINARGTLSVTSDFIQIDGYYTDVVSAYGGIAGVAVNAAGDITFDAQSVFIGQSSYSGGSGGYGDPVVVASGGTLDINVAGNTLYLYDGAVLSSDDGFFFPETVVDGTARVETADGPVFQDAGTAIREYAFGYFGTAGLRIAAGSGTVGLVNAGNEISRIDIESAGDVTIASASASRPAFEIGEANLGGTLDVTSDAIFLDGADETGTPVASTIGGGLSLDTPTTITADPALDLTVVGETSLTAFLLSPGLETPGSIAIDAPASDFQGTLSALAGDILISTGGALTLDNTVAIGTGDFATADPGAGITVTNLFVSGETTIASAGDVSLSGVQLGGAGIPATVDAATGGTVTIDNAIVEDLLVGTTGTLAGIAVSNSDIGALRSDLASAAVTLDTVALDTLDLPDTLDGFEARTVNLAGGDLTVAAVSPGAGPVVIDDLTGGGSVYLTANDVELGSLSVPVLEIAAAGSVTTVPDAELRNATTSITNFFGPFLTGDAATQAAAAGLSGGSLYQPGASYLLEVGSGSITTTAGGTLELVGGTADGLRLENDFAGALYVAGFDTVTLTDANALDVTVSGAGDVTIETDIDETGLDGGLTGSIEHSGLARVQTNGAQADIEVTQSGTAALQLTTGGFVVTAIGDVVVENSHGPLAGGILADGDITLRDSVIGSTAGFISYGGGVTLERVEIGAPGELVVITQGGTGDVVLRDISAPGVILGNYGGGAIGGDVTLERFALESLGLGGDVVGTLTLDTGTISDGLALVTTLGGLSLTAFELTAGDLVIADGTLAPGGLLTLDGVSAPNVDVTVPNLALGFLATDSLSATVTGDVTTVADAALSDPSGTDVTIVQPVLSGDTADAVTLGTPTVIAREAFADLVAVTGSTTLDGPGILDLPGSGIAANDFGGTVTVTDFSSATLGDGDAIEIDVSGVGALDVAANTDGIGADGTVTGTLSAYGGVYVTGDDIALSGILLSSGGSGLNSFTATNGVELTDMVAYGDIALAGGGAVGLYDTVLVGDGTLVSTGGDVTVARVEAALSAPGDAGLDLAAGGSVAASDLEAEALSIGAGAPVGGDVTLTRLLVGDLSVPGTVGGTLALTESRVTGPIDIGGTLGGLTLATLDLGDLTVAPGSLASGSMLTLDRIRAGAIDVVAPELALGFLEALSLTAAVSGDVVKLANAALDPDAASATVAAPVLGPERASILDSQPAPDTLDFDAFTTLVALSGGLDATSSGGGAFLLPRGVVDGAEFHNTVLGPLALEGFQTVVFEDAGDIAPEITAAGDIALRADADGTGSGAIVGDVDFSGTGSFLAPGDVTLSGGFGTLFQAIAGQVLLSSADGDVVVGNTRATSLNINTGGQAPSAGAVTVRDTELATTLTLSTQASGDPAQTATIERVSTGGSIGASGFTAVTARDVQAAELSVAAEGLTVERAALTGIRTGGIGGGEIDALSLTDVAVAGDLDVAAGAGGAMLARVAATGPMAVSTTGTLTAEDLIAGAAMTLAGEDMTVDRVSAGSLAVTGGAGNAFVSDVVAATVAMESDGFADLRRVATGSLDIDAAGAAVQLFDLAVDGPLTVDAAQVNLFDADVAGTARFLSGDTAFLSGVSAGGDLEIGGPGATGFQTSVSLNQSRVGGDLTIASLGDIAVTDLVVDGQSVLAAGGDLEALRFRIGDYAGIAAGALRLDSGVAGRELTPEELTNPLAQAVLIDDPDSAEITLSNLNFEEIDFVATGNITATGVRVQRLLRLESTDGEITFGEVSGNPRRLIAARVNQIPSTGLTSDFTIFAPGAVLGAAAAAGPAGAAGPNGAGAVDIGIEVGALLGDAPDPAIIGATVAPAAGSPDQPGAGGSDDLPPDEPEVVPIRPPEPEAELDERDEKIVEQVLAQDLVEEEQALAAPFFVLEEPAFALPRVDFGALFSASGNENLWTRGFADEDEEAER